MTTTLVTGGAGFIGSHIAHALVARGESVRVLDDLSTGRLDNLADIADAIEFVEGSVLDAKLVRTTMVGVDYVLHQAAIASVPLSVEHPIDVDRVNVEGTLQVLEAARAESVRRVVMAVSCAAYGESERLPSREDDPVDPISPYAVTKLVDEHYARVYSTTMGLEAVALRYFNVFGPRQDPAGPYAAVIPLFTEAAIAGRQPTIFGTGEQTRDFVYVGNVAQANILAREAPEAAGHVINIGSGVGTSLLDLVDQIGDALGVSLRPEHAAARAGDILHSRADISRARELLGYEPLIPFAEGLRRTVEWYTLRGGK